MKNIFYYSKELQTGYLTEIKNGRLYLVNKAINYRTDIIPVSTDLFLSRGQKIRFIRSLKTKKITGLTLETIGLKDVLFIKK